MATGSVRFVTRSRLAGRSFLKNQTWRCGCSIIHGRTYASQGRQSSLHLSTTGTAYKIAGPSRLPYIVTVARDLPRLSLTPKRSIKPGHLPFSTTVRSREERHPQVQPDHHQSAARPADPRDSKVAQAERSSGPTTVPHSSTRLEKVSQSLSQVHRPTKEELLRAATSFWQRLKVRFKWLTIRGNRKFNLDEVTGIFSWLIIGHGLWILIGTTGFFSILFATANSLQLQEWVATQIGNYLTSETGITVRFESAIVPKWKASRISFTNLYISRRSSDPTRRLSEPNNLANFLPAVKADEVERQEDNDNFTQFDLTIESVDVTLSLRRWLDGKGLIKEAHVKGVRGFVDRRHISNNPRQQKDPSQARRKHKLGDFELEGGTVEDVLVTIYHPDDFRPFNLSIFNAELSGLRKQWLFLDLLSAERITGQFDNCLFSLHRPQSVGRTANADLQTGKWKRVSRLRVDGIPIDHINRNAHGPISWITSGKVDVVANIYFPREPEDEMNLVELFEEIKGNIEGVLGHGTLPEASGMAMSQPLPATQPRRTDEKPVLRAPPAQSPVPTTSSRSERTDETLDLGLTEKGTADRQVVMELDIRLRDVKADVPYLIPNLTYMNNALVRPIVAFLNANRTLIPVSCQVSLNLSELDGAWNAWECGLLQAISQEVYKAFAWHVTSAQIQQRRIKRVGLWSLQMGAEMVLNGLRTLSGSNNSIAT